MCESLCLAGTSHQKIFFFFCLLNSLGAEALANWELNGGKSQARRFVHEMDFFVPLRICCKQI